MVKYQQCQIVPAKLLYNYNVSQSFGAKKIIANTANKSTVGQSITTLTRLII